ncbi:MAG: hypothetical protein IJY61_01135 [Candidatus Gastranaerophilales bacterium]|nr:hypothetical protein [Candidatus Gastranaerophilales bacterium]
MFIKFLYLGLFYFCIQLIGFCYSEEILSELEYQKYGATFQNESLAQRLSKLETDFLGMEQKGSIDERLDLLYRISNNSRTTAIQKPYYPSSSIKKKSAIRKFFDNIGDIGTMTGFTPSLSSTTYNNGSYYDSYGNNNLSNWGNRVFNNFLDTQNNYCPYHNSHHNNHFNHPIHNRHWMSNNINREYTHSYMPQHIHPQNRVVRNFYIPPNIQSRTSVKIIRD